VYAYENLIIIFCSTDRRGIVTPEFAAEQARAAEDRDSVITNNKTYGTVRTLPPVVRETSLYEVIHLFITS
jgi:hypothetical protein